MTENSLITITSLASQPVMVFLTQAIVGATKGVLDRIVYVPTMLYAWAVAAVLIIVSELVQGEPAGNWVTYYLGILNGLVISLAAGKSNDLALKPPALRSFQMGRAEGK